jgi:hypothetical protein
VSFKILINLVVINIYNLSVSVEINYLINYNELEYYIEINCRYGLVFKSIMLVTSRNLVQEIISGL